jgi:hypothetical protein
MPVLPYAATAEWWNATNAGTRHADMSPAALRDAYGASPDVWRHRRNRASDRMKDVAFGDVTLPMADAVPPTPCGSCMTIEEKVERDREVARLRAVNANLQTRYNVALRDSTLAEYLVRKSADIMPRLGAVTAPAVIASREAKSHETAVLFCADWHSDEVVRYEVMDGLNAYDPYIMARRVECLTDKTLEMVLGHHAGTRFDELVIADLGDNVGGPLHQETAMTNALPPFRAAVMIADIKAQMAAKIAAHFPRVRRVSVPGNHWRYTKQVPWKLPSETTDWLVYNMEAQRLSEIGNITVEIPDAWSQYVEIAGTMFALNHGYSDAKGGFGGLSAYSFFRADAKRTGIEARKGQFVPYRVYGHVHSPAELSKLGGKGRLIICPSLKGGDEFALEALGAYSDPEQRLVGVHEGHGIVWTRDLDVTGYDTRQECCYDDTLALHVAGR